MLINNFINRNYKQLNHWQVFAKRGMIMSQIPPGMPPMPSFGSSSAGPGAAKGAYGSSGSGAESLQQWIESYCGPQGWAKFQSNLCQMIANSIQHDQQEMKKANQQLKESETGQD